MEKKSLFREFIASLGKRWKAEHPSIRPLVEARGGLPKASTFYAGMINGSGKHVYLNFQHSSKSWEVGRFTINIVLSSDELNPDLYSQGEWTGSDFKDGSYRIGHLIGKKDKWWHLKPDDDPVLADAWRPTSYAKPESVIFEAVDNVTSDVLHTLKLLKVPFE